MAHPFKRTNTKPSITLYSQLKLHRPSSQVSSESKSITDSDSTLNRMR